MWIGYPGSGVGELSRGGDHLFFKLCQADVGLSTEPCRATQANNVQLLLGIVRVQQCGWPRGMERGVDGGEPDLVMDGVEGEWIGPRAVSRLGRTRRPDKKVVYSVRLVQHSFTF
jgi:hypothetical protein